MNPNLPNYLCYARIVAVPVFLAFVYLGALAKPLGLEQKELLAGVGMVLGLVLLIAVAVTDWLDGVLARKWGVESNLGRLLDPLADKIFVTAALVAMVDHGVIPAWATILIIAREFLVTGLRSLAAEQGIVIAADRLGKHKLGWQIALLVTALLTLSVRHFLSHAGWWESWNERYAFGMILTGMVWIPLIVTLILTVWSGVQYTWNSRALLTGADAR